MMKTFLSSPFMPELALFLVLISVSAMTSFAVAIILAASLDMAISWIAERRNSVRLGQDRGL